MTTPAQKSKESAKRPSKGQRKYIRRLKQAAGKDAHVTNPQNAPAKPARAPKKKDD
jgi:hypothetical protein